MQTEKRVNVDDLRDVLKFWEMKDEIEQFAARVYWGIEYKATLEYEALALKTKIESIGKKDIVAQAKPKIDAAITKLSKQMGDDWGKKEGE